MPRGELYLNKDANGDWQDAYDKWGLSMNDTGLSVLMTPAPHKEYITDESRLEHGRRIIVDSKIASRILNLPVHIKAPNKELFYQRYLSFCEVLEKGDIHIKTKYQPEIVYKCVYVDCKQYSQFRQEMAHFTLILEEPNPSDRRM